MSGFTAGIIVGAAITVALTLFVLASRSWRHATFSAVRVPWPAVIGMRLRGTPATLVVDALVALHKRGYPTELHLVETVFLANRSPELSVTDLADLVQENLDRSEPDAS